MGCSAYGTACIGVIMNASDIADKRTERFYCSCGADVPDQFCSKCGRNVRLEDIWTPSARWNGDLKFPYDEGENLSVQLEELEPFGSAGIQIAILHHGEIFNPEGLYVVVGWIMKASSRSIMASYLERPVTAKSLGDLRETLQGYGIMQEPKLMSWVLLR